MKKIILITTVFFFLLSCKKEYVPFVIPCTLSTDPNLAKNFIKGTWEWVETKDLNVSIQGYKYLTPKTEGYNLKMIIGDSTYQFFEKDKLEGIHKYKIQLELEITNFPSDSSTVFASYRIADGVREFYVPIKICNGFLLQQFQYVSSYSGERIWRKQ